MKFKYTDTHAQVRCTWPAWLILLCCIYRYEHKVAAENHLTIRVRTAAVSSRVILHLNSFSLYFSSCEGMPSDLDNPTHHTGAKTFSDLKINALFILIPFMTRPSTLSTVQGFFLKKTKTKYMTEHENVLPSLPRQFNWNRQNILYLQHDSESLALDTSVYYAFEANARQVRGTEQSNVSVCWSLHSRVDFYDITWRWGESFLPMPKRSNWLLYPVDLTFIPQDPESEEGSTETDVPKVRNSCLFH